MKQKLAKIKKNRNKGTSLRTEVVYLEKWITANLNSIWGNDTINIEFTKIMNLDIDERRLFLVYILMNQSIIKTSRYFDVDRKTVSQVLKYIKEKLGINTVSSKMIPHPKQRKTIEQYTLDGDFVREWDGCLSVEKELNISNAHISSCCNGSRQTAGGYVWRFKNKDIK